MKKVLLLLFVGLSSQLIGQQTSISGVVAVFNSAFETGSREYVSNAQIEDDFKKANATTTGADGRFKLIFVGTKDNEKVSFNVKKERLEIVNTEALYAVAGQKEQVAVFMSPEGKVAENKLKYYQINREAAEKALTSKLKTIGDEILKLKQNERANAGQIEKLQTEYGFLQKQYEKIDQSARGMAERYAKINLDDQTKEYQTAFRYFQKGQLEEALKILNQVDLEKTGSAIVQEQERNRKIDKEWMERDSIKNEKKRQVTEALGFKADLHKTQFEFVKVEETYQLLLRLDSTNIYSLWAYAYFLAEQNKNYEATAYYERALALAQTLELIATFQNNLGLLYRANQKMPQAEGAYNEALKIYRQLADNNPDAFLPGLANILNNLGNYYRANQKMSQAEGAYNEALIIKRQLADKNPDTFLPELANTLNDLGLYYYTNQKMPQAEVIFNEALKIRRQLADNNPDAFLPDIATTLNNLGAYYYANQKMPQAEGAYNEALKIKRQLAEKNPDAFLPDLAMTLNNLGEYYRINQKMQQAEEAFNEALKIYRLLAEKNPDAFLLNVAGTLNNLGNYYRDNQKMLQAEGAFNEALRIKRQLAEKNPDAFLPDVSKTLNNLGVFYKMLKQYDKALDHSGEALGYREGAILKGGTHLFIDWLQVLRNIAEVRDSAGVKKDYASVVKAGRLLAEGCDHLKGVNEKLFRIAVAQYGSLSWWALFAKDYALSEKAARRCLELDETRAFVLTNLGHSQILRGQYNSGMTTYEKLKGKKDSEGKDYKQVLLNTLTALEAEGITHKDFAQARAAIEKW
jgi:tetratricopeptide (TPR) repeat protein